MAADCGSDAACESAMRPPDSMMASAPSRTAMAMSDTSALKLGRAALMTPLSATSKVQSTGDSPKQGEQHVQVSVMLPSRLGHHPMALHTTMCSTTHRVGVGFCTMDSSLRGKTAGAAGDC